MGLEHEVGRSSCKTRYTGLQFWTRKRD